VARVSTLESLVSLAVASVPIVVEIPSAAVWRHLLFQ
jgi:hypothetical protein